MTRKIHLIVVLTLVSLGLLLNVSIFSVPAAEIRLENSIGRHEFNLSKEGDNLFSKGYIVVTNVHDEDVELCFTIITKLKLVDLNSDGTPRRHSIDNKFFYPFPNKSWIEIEDDKFIIPASSTYKFYYILNMSVTEAFVGINENTSNGYLCYINVKGLSSSIIGINYDYKIFAVFKGTYTESVSSSNYNIFSTIIALVLLSLIVCSVVNDKIKRRKKSED